jgi:hypothetical protein
MTIQALINLLSEHPIYVLAYFALLPLLAWVTNWISMELAHTTPWKYLYSFLLFAVCVPGIFSVALSIYLFLFQRGNILNSNVFTQILPVLSMVVTIAVVRKNVALEHIPGSERISSLVFLISAVLTLMYLIDRTHIIAWVSVPVGYFLLILITLLVVVRIALKNLMA